MKPLALLRTSALLCAASLFPVLASAQARPAAPVVSASDLVVCANFALCTSTGAVRFNRGAWVVSNDGGSLITDNGGGMLPKNVAGAISDNGSGLRQGDILAGAAANLAKYHVAGVGGTRMTSMHIVRH